jgi:hypothetical protein
MRLIKDVHYGARVHFRRRCIRGRIPCKTKKTQGNCMEGQSDCGSR